MDAITLTVDGMEVEVRRGATVLEAIEKAGVYIPTLCHHPDLVPFGACRLCIVEVDKMRGFPPACATPAADGMVVHTNSPQLQELRRNILELILSEHPHSCLICPRREDCEPFRTSMRKMAVSTGCLYCPQNGRCELQKVARYLRSMRSAFPTPTRVCPWQRLVLSSSGTITCVSSVDDV